MKLRLMTIFGQMTFDAVGKTQLPVQTFDPIMFGVGRQMAAVDSIPIALTDIASAIGHPIWYNKETVSVVPPAGPDGISLGEIGQTLSCTIERHTNMIHPLRIDFEAVEHVLPIMAGSVADVNIYEPGSTSTVVTSRTIFAGRLSNTTASEVVLSAKLLGIMIRANPDGSTDVTIGRDHGGVHEVSSVATTVLIAGYLGLIAGYAKARRSDQTTNVQWSWTMLALDGPICALAVIFSNGSKIGGEAVFKNLSIVIISAIGIGLGFFFSTRSNARRESTERRFLEPALVAALQAPFAGRTGILAQAVAGMVVSAIAVRNLDLIKAGEDNVKFIVERVFALAVVTWMSPLLLNLAVEDSLQTTNTMMTYPVSLSISLVVAMLVICLSNRGQN